MSGQAHLDIFVTSSCGYVPIWMEVDREHRVLAVPNDLQCLRLHSQALNALLGVRPLVCRAVQEFGLSEHPSAVCGLDETLAASLNHHSFIASSQCSAVI